MTVEKMNAVHVPGICELEKDCFSSPWSEEGIKAELKNPNAKFFVCVEDGEVLGYIGTYLITDECYINNLAVGEKHRRQGIGELLLSTACAGADESGAKFITLEVRKSNNPAVNLYQKNGFEVAGIRKGFYENPKEDAYIMTKYFRGEKADENIGN